MASNSDHYDITIVGGGMVGASLACALGNQDLRIAILEAHNAKLDTPASYDDRAIALSYGTSQIFRTLGFWEELEASSTPIKQIHVSDKGTCLIWDSFENDKLVLKISARHPFAQSSFGESFRDERRNASMFGSESQP